MSKRGAGRKWDAQFTRESVARAGGNNAESRVAERHGPTNLVDGAVPAPRNDELRALPDGFAGQLVRMPSAFVSRMSAFSPTAARAAEASRARSAAVPRRAEPETGLMMTKVIVESEEKGDAEADDDDDAADAFRADATGHARPAVTAGNGAHGHDQRPRPRTIPIANK